MKERYTSKFNKDNFVIDAMSIDVESAIDPYIKDFILNLNKNKDIMTIYSCEGHKEGDHAYLMFNVSDEGWDIFWNQVMPELSERLCTQVNDDDGDISGLYQTTWFVSLTDNEYNTSLTLYSVLEPFLDVSWEDKKETFWGVMSETFLKYYNETI